MVAALHVGKVPPALPALRVDLGVGLVPAGFIVSTFNVLGMSLGLVAGVTADRLGRRRLVGLGFVALALGGTAGAVSQGVPVLLASRLLEGLGFMAVSVATPALVLAVTAPRDRSLALSLWSVFMPAGMAIALAGAPLVLEAADWRALWLTVAGLAVMGGAAVTTATAGIARSTPPPGASWRVLIESVTRPGLLLMAATFGAYAFQWIAVMVWLPTFLPEALGVTGRAAALLTALVVLMNAPGNLVGGGLLRRGVTGTRIIVVASVAMALCGWGLFSPALADPVRFALVLLFSTAGGLIPAALFAGTPAEAPSPGHLAAANGLLMQGSNIGQFLGPPLVAAAVTAAGGAWNGAQVPVMVAAALTALIALTHGRWRRTGRVR
nr:MFS transporter [Roseospira visakhapatnamensis]